MPASASSTPTQTRPGIRTLNRTSAMMGVMTTLVPTANPETAAGRPCSAMACPPCPTPNMTPRMIPLIHTVGDSPRRQPAG